MRTEDEYPFERNARACVLRIGTIASVSGDGRKLTVNVPGGPLPNVSMTTAIDTPTSHIGERVAVLLDRDSALAIGLVR